MLLEIVDANGEPMAEVIISSTTAEVRAVHSIYRDVTRVRLAVILQVRHDGNTKLGTNDYFKRYICSSPNLGPAWARAIGYDRGC